MRELAQIKEVTSEHEPLFAVKNNEGGESEREYQLH